MTFSEDHEGIDRVIEELAARGHQAVRLDTDGYPQDLTLSTRYVGGTRHRLLRQRGREHDLEHCTAVWYRRFRAGDRLVEAGLGDQLDGAYRESRHTLWGSIASLPCRQVDRWAAVRQADLKELQTEWALQAGLDLPRTLFSNDPEEARAFYHELEGRMVVKLQAPLSLVRDGQRQVMYTSPVRPGDLAGLSGLRYSPMIFQERIDKQLDVRVVVIGERMFGAAVDPQGELDWRKEGESLHRQWVPWEVPESVATSLRQLMTRLDLSYGAADFVVSQGRCLFLEVNAVGEWLWLEQQAGLPLAAALADLLSMRNHGQNIEKSQRDAAG